MRMDVLLIFCKPFMILLFIDMYFIRMLSLLFYLSLACDETLFDLMLYLSYFTHDALMYLVCCISVKDMLSSQIDTRAVFLQSSSTVQMFRIGYIFFL